MIRAGLALTLVSGCAPYQAPPATPPSAAAGPSLYERLGGVDAIRLVVDDFGARLAADTTIAPLFSGVDLDNVKRLLVDQICQATGGPCVYRGRSMRAAHTGLGITAAQWDATIGHLVAALNRYSVPLREQRELLGALAGMRGDIVGR
ncbi:MAG TPA: group 1 truncated hemoglobin [Gemmatimonadales bacterium]|nr:group 1 truncated hemoglobin [Gemmatimonadales bacterium]